MTEERIEAVENLTRQHSQELQGMYVAFREIRDTLQALASASLEQRAQINRNTENISQLTVNLAELKQSTTDLRLAIALQSESMRSTSDNVERVSNVVERLATEAAQDRATIREMQSEVREIWEYLLRERGNGKEP